MTLQDTEPSDGAPEAEAANGSNPVQVVEEAPFTVTAPVPYTGSGSLRNPFPPIADYAFLSDCENTCLISSAGSVPAARTCAGVCPALSQPPQDTRRHE